MPFRWTVNPYRGCSHACVYCFARPTHKYLDMDAGRDFERQIVVKVNVPEVLRAELSRPSWTREHVAMGTNTDPYQWVEGRYRLMPGIWEALRDTRNAVLRADEVPARAARPPAAAGDRRGDEREREPLGPDPRRGGLAGDGAAHAAARARGSRRSKALNAAGIPTGILIAPLMPGINDAPEQVEAILALAADAGATSVGGITLHLRGEVRGDLPRLAALAAPGPRAALRGALRAAAPTRRGPSGGGSRRVLRRGRDRFRAFTRVRAGGSRAAGARARRDAPAPAPRRPRRAPAQAALF